MKKILFTLVLLLCFSGVEAKTNDTTLSFNNLYDYYYEIEGGGMYLSNYTTMFLANKKIAYCIEPGVSVTTSTYDSNLDFSETNLTNEQTKMLELFGYFGYDYPGHNTTKYYLAAQELIWEYMKDVEVKFTTAKNGAGSEIDLEYEKKEILKLIEEYNKEILFEESIFSINVENILEDKNNILKNYEIIDSEITAKIENGKLVFNSSNPGIKTITLKYKKYDNNTTLVYSKGDSQKLASLRLSKEKFLNVELNFKAGTITIDKEGEELIEENPYYYEMKGLENVKFGIYDLEDNLIMEVITNKDGNANFNSLSFGKYYLKELENKHGHIIDDKKYYFEISKENLVEKIAISNYLPKGNVEVIKTDENGNLLNDAVFGLYTKKNNLIGQKITQNGIVEFNSLPFGEYYIKELSAPKGYILDNQKYFFEIAAENKKINITNDLIDVPITSKNNLIFVLLGKLFALLKNIF